MMVPIKYTIFIILAIVIPLTLSVKKDDQSLTKYKINDNEWKKAQDIINKLVDESIANRVTEAEKDMTSLLQQNIGCEDKIEHCDTLAAAGVCKTSKKAMEKHCAKTCKLCGTKLIHINPQVEIVMKPKSSKPLKLEKSEDKVDAKVKAEVLHKLFASSKSDSLLEPLLSQQSSVAMKYHDNKDLTTENEKIRDAQKLLEYVKVLHVKKAKPEVHQNAAKKHITKMPSKKSKTSKKVHGVPMDNLSKTVTYKNQKYKITPVVDWKKISKMLKSLGYKAIHIMGMKNKHLEKGIKAHMKNMNHDEAIKVIVGKNIKPHAAKELHTKAIHREKSYRNPKWFKENCHPFCLKACISSCNSGCCKEHDLLDKKTGLLPHCHPKCKETCVCSCGSGCCSPEEEKRRRVTKYCDKPSITPTKKGPQATPAFRLNDIHHDEKPHPALVNPKLYSPDIYKPQKRLCPNACFSQSCAPACTDQCCRFGEYARTNDALRPGQKHNPGLMPNVPYLRNRGIPGNAVRCAESCRFRCDVTCADDCCQPEGLAQRAARLQLPYYYNSQQQPVVTAYQPLNQQQNANPNPLSPQMNANPNPLSPQMNANPNPVCTAPCPNTCYPSCNPACCQAALGMPVDDQPESRSATRKVIHIQHILHPVERKGLVPGSCPAYCGNHCTPICARSECCVK